MTGLRLLEHLLRRDRLIVLIGLLAVVTLAWTYLATGAGMDVDMMTEMPDMEPMPWTPVSAALLFAMWWVMMIAMMVPSAAPTVLLYAAVRRKERAPAATTESLVFLAGYLAMWAAFSLVAVVAQWLLERAGLLSMAMTSTSLVLGGVILVAAGLYQFTPLKTACLRSCQSPLLFLSQHWRPGTMGAFGMGLRHGGYCVGCCWFLMALLFVSGVMNLVWIVGIAVYVGCEKLLPLGRRLSQVAGAVLILSGAVMLGRGI